MTKILTFGGKIVTALMGTQDRLSYRRLLVFAVATGLLVWTTKLDAQTWFYVALAYLGTEVAEKILVATKRPPASE